jgi:hypothetical protein
MRDMARFTIVTNKTTDFSIFDLFVVSYVSIHDVINIPTKGVNIKEDNNIKNNIKH